MINPIEYVHYLPFNFSQHLHILFCNTEKVFLAKSKRVGGRGRGGRKSSQTQTIPQTILDQKMRTQRLQQHSQLLPLQPGARRIIDSTKNIFICFFIYIFLTILCSSFPSGLFTSICSHDLFFFSHEF